VPMMWSLEALQTRKGLYLEAMGIDMKSARPWVGKDAEADLNEGYESRSLFF
jgi:hypothetical protein